MTHGTPGKTYVVADIDCGGDDCNDNDARTAGGAVEVCDRVDVYAVTIRRGEYVDRH